MLGVELIYMIKINPNSEATKQAQLHRMVGEMQASFERLQKVARQIEAVPTSEAELEALVRQATKRKGRHSGKF